MNSAHLARFACNCITQKKMYRNWTNFFVWDQNDITSAPYYKAAIQIRTLGALTCLDKPSMQCKCQAHT